MIVVIDHIRGARSGLRVRFDDKSSISFGRHPDNDVSFDGKRDIDASTRHAVLERKADTYVLRDLGSSNGTWIGGAKTSEHSLEPAAALEVEFGRGGPVAKIWIGSSEASIPKPPRPTARWLRFLRR